MHFFSVEFHWNMAKTIVAFTVAEVQKVIVYWIKE
jgi:hypothetical protein